MDSRPFQEFKMHQVTVTFAIIVRISGVLGLGIRDLLAVEGLTVPGEVSDWTEMVGK